MKIVTFTAPCSGIGAVYNKGDVGRFPDSVADAIVAAKKGTAEPVPDDTTKKGAS
ncbi:hypothetical protein [Acetobacter sp. LMG 32666]|uniref:hypothetical protein n=1 Tax=Acetobacter sp. LMG 32666 TaxID=2959295 RepID=UPI0030C7A667